MLFKKFILNYFVENFINIVFRLTWLMKSFKGIPISRMLNEKYFEKLSWRHLKSDQLVNGLKGSVEKSQKNTKRFLHLWSRSGWQTKITKFVNLFRFYSDWTENFLLWYILRNTNYFRNLLGFINSWYVYPALWWRKFGSSTFWVR